MRTQFSPAPAICAKSDSVYHNDGCQRISHIKLEATYNERLVVIFELVESAIGSIRGHVERQRPFVYGR